MDTHTQLIQQQCCLLPAAIGNTLFEPGAVKVKCSISPDQAVDQLFLAQLTNSLSRMVVKDSKCMHRIDASKPIVGVGAESLSTAGAAVQHGSSSIYSIYNSVFPTDEVGIMIALFVLTCFLLAAYTAILIYISPPRVTSIPATRRPDGRPSSRPPAPVHPTTRPRHRPERPLDTALTQQRLRAILQLRLQHPRHPTSTPPVPAATLHDLAPAALSASSLLSTFAATALTDTDSSRNSTQKKRLDMALLALLSVRAGMRERYGAGGMHVKSGDLVVDAGCVVCCAEVVETVLMPCRHMVVCKTCCATMGLGKRRIGRQTGMCPVCRVVVENTIQVFRG